MKRDNELEDIDRITELERRLELLDERLRAIEQQVPPGTIPPLDVDPMSTKCPHCNLDFSGTMGYVCSLSTCPMQSKVSDFPFGLNTGG